MGIRKLIGKWLRRASAQLMPLIAYFSLVFGRRRRVTGDAGTVIEVRDRGSEVTVVSFAGIAALHGGMVNYEFTDLLKRFAFEPNVVFVRDPLCSCYHLTPDGEPGGLDYYAELVDEAVERLGGRQVVAVGTSIGGMAAITLGHRLRFDQVIAFSPSWPPPRYFLEPGPKAAWTRFKMLFKHPAAWLERLLLAQMAFVSARRLEAAVGTAGVLDLEAELERARRVPRITVFYGEGCVPDVRTAEAMARVASAEIVGLPTPMHNTSGYMKANGTLIPAIVSRVESRVAARQLVLNQSTPPPAFALESHIKPRAQPGPRDARSVGVAS